ncbi:LysR family transcriptional regulator [Candidatus Halocynthiibacter alkanivorans]|uniref:LysR family transcriptional regulator n=1 Tax=Candidatus Halocynthiibacter alkanivorans TaxID=2267619 RepID=UPI000DF3A4D1|nr:LysR family transcriptional regulator [Candidatus Halocynthiibacter alkanivorans]
MDIPPTSPDWTLLQSFAAVARHGSLSAAARALGHSQPTIGRHIKSLEVSLGMELFTRQSRGFVLTKSGHSLLRYAEQMADAAAQLSLVAEGQSGDLSGTVRITASSVVSFYLLPPIIKELREARPEISIDLVPSNISENLLFRDADIAIRMFRPTQPDLIARHIADLPMSIYGTRSYFDSRPLPKSIADFMALDFVGYDRDEMILRTMNEMGLPVERDFFTTRCDDQLAFWQLIRAGCGIGASMDIIADGDPDMLRLDLALELPDLPMWLTAPQALHTAPRIRAVWDHLVRALTARVS